MTGASPRIFGLDFMRASAILMVLGSHTLSLFDSPDFKGIELLHFFGYFGVEVFFVLSGYLIGNILLKITAKPDFSFSDIKIFWIRRWLRTLPNYFLALTINLLLAYFLWNNPPDMIWTYFLFLQNLMVQPMFFNESWSLSIEEYTYLLFPLLLLFLYRFNPKTVFVWSAILFIMVFFLLKVNYHFNIAQNNLQFWGSHMKSVLIYRLDAIPYGILAAWIIKKYPEFVLRNNVVFLFAASFIVAFLLFGIGLIELDMQNAPFFWNVLYLPLTSISVMLTLPFFESWNLRQSLFTKPIVLISKISYSIYLFHYFIILYLFTEFVKPLATTDSLRLGYVLAYLLTTFLMSWLVYILFENPILKWRDRNFPIERNGSTA